MKFGFNRSMQKLESNETDERSNKTIKNLVGACINWNFIPSCGDVFQVKPWLNHMKSRTMEAAAGT